MKNFRLSFIDENGDFRETTRKYASDIIAIIRNRNLKTFEIEWKTPITKEYATLITVGAKKTIINNRFEIPKIFKEILF